MRKILLALSAVLVLVPVAAGAQEAYLEVLRSDVRAEKVALVTEMMMMTDEQAQVFWPIYREMENEVLALSDQRIALIKEYAENYENMTDKAADGIVARSFKLREKSIAIEKKYWKRFKKALDPVTAAKFYQVNREIDQMIDIQVSAGLPFIK